MIRWAPWEGVASDLATRPLQRSGVTGPIGLMRSRLARSGLTGELRVSSPPGSGTTITASLPCAS